MSRLKFDIKYRPQIESGEYEVKTRFGEPVEIVKWDCRGEYPILACIFDGDTDDSAFFSNDGKGISGSEDVLYIITPEPELTDFEKKLWEVLKSEGSPIGPIEKFTNADKEVFHSYAAELLAIAKEECKNQIKNDYREIIHGAYEKGMENALKDLPRWGLSTGCFDNGWVNDGILYYKFHAIPLKTLEVLPGFKED